MPVRRFVTPSLISLFLFSGIAIHYVRAKPAGMAFLPCFRSRSTPHTEIKQQFAKRKKESMEEKRQRRASKQLRKLDEKVSQLPPSKLNFKSQPKSEPIASPSPDASNVPAGETQSRAKQLVEAQRQSVDMLSYVKSRIEETFDAEAINTGIDEQGFFVVDNFLGDNSELMQALRTEGALLLTEGKMETDTSKLGSGEFTTPIRGGEEQYKLAPRSIEMVVSATKNIPLAFKNVSGTSWLHDLDDTACMASMRTFDRKVYLASLALLTGEDNIEKSSGAGNNEKPLDSSLFRTVVEDSKTDKRRLSMCHFLTPYEWQEPSDCGGGFLFSVGETITNVEAKCDRLVLWRADSTRFKRIPFEGKDDLNIASCVEVHFVEQTNE